MTRTLGLGIAGLAALALATGAAAKPIKGPLSTEAYDVGALFAPSERTVALTVTDGREDRSLLGGGIVGPKGDAGKGIMVVYLSERDEEVAKLLDAAARSALGVLGLEPGDGGAQLEVTLRSLWVDMHRMSGFSPMNCLGYLTLDTRLTSEPGAAPAERSFKLTLYETANPVASMKEVSREGVSRILQQAVWQAVARTLAEAWGLHPDPERLAALANRVGTLKEAVQARQAIFWLGLVGGGDEATVTKLRGFLGSDEQRVHQAAAEALGLAGATAAVEDLQAILGGAKRGGWDVTDLEHVWYLVHGLRLLGAPAEKIPAGLEPASKMADLLHFHASGGEAPAFTEEEEKKLAKERPKVAKKRS